MRQLRPHIVHTHSSKAGILGRIAAYAAGVPVIIHTFHGFGFTPGQSSIVRQAFVWAEKACAALSTHLVYVSEANRREAAERGLGRSIPNSLIRSGIPMNFSFPSIRGADRRFLSRETPDRRGQTTSLRKKWGIPDAAWLVLSIGNFKPQKNPMDLAKTAKAVFDQDPSVHFIFVGDGELRTAVEGFVQAEGMAAQVHFLGWRKDISAILSASNCFLLTSLWEGLPRALVEAAVARLPAVAYAVNGVKDILIEGETGFPIPPHETALAAEKILWLKAHPFDARQLGSQARTRIEKEFDIDKMVQQQENLYQTLYDAVPLKTYYLNSFA